MKRLHLFEIEDQPWCPAPLRDAATDFLRFALHAGDSYAPAAPLLAELLREAGESAVVDLCSGGGGPWARLLPALRAEGVGPLVTLTDLYPNLDAFRRAAEGLGGALRYEPTPVDAAAVPARLRGVRTLFTGFHHFAPPAARALLRDAVRAGQPIAVFEATERSARGLLATAISPLLVLLATPLIRPLRLSRLVFTYLVPLVPLLVLWDGMVSCLRSYTAAEMAALAAEAEGAGGYRWRAGQARGRGPIPVTYLIGVPARRTAGVGGDAPAALPPRRGGA